LASIAGRKKGKNFSNSQTFRNSARRRTRKRRKRMEGGEEEEMPRIRRSRRIERTAGGLAQLHLLQYSIRSELCRVC
jgi:hypothetical protein